MSAQNFQPFGNDTQSISAGPGEGLTFENGQESIIVYGDLDIERSAQSRKGLNDLIELLSKVRDSLPEA